MTKIANPQIELSIVLPCLNEEQTVGICVVKAVDFLKRNNIEGEVLVADNGSTDRSVEIAQQQGAAHPRTMAFRLRGR
jgi:glycosyltransferase involved in cell wall biosynthesis